MESEHIIERINGAQNLFFEITNIVALRLSKKIRQRILGLFYTFHTF